ncbi:MAG: DUF2231 domain-containing protein [Gammaproteobacteria bacterium]|nr:DUF2231 domain-containing protein [Gammaproteobacteria bacterium]
MIEIIPNWHPIFVHFTVALLTVAIAFFALVRFTKNQRLREQWLTVAYWNLWLGGGFSVITGIAGWFAFNSVNHDTPSHEAMIEHRDLALITIAVVVPLALWSWWKYRAGGKVNGVFLVLLLASGGLLASTAWHGAELVYRYGLGVKSLPKAEGEGHAHSHDDGGGHDHGDTGAMAPAPAPPSSTASPADETQGGTPAQSDSHSHDEPHDHPEKKPHPHKDDPARPHTH